MATTGADKYSITSTQGVINRLSEILSDIDLRLNNAESRFSATDRAVQEVASQAIRYLESVVVPSATKVSELLRSLNNLFETTSTSTVEISSSPVEFTINPQDREVFATLGYVIATAVGAQTTSGLGGPVVSFDQNTGVVVIDPDYTWGSGQFSSWKLTASPDILAITKAADPVITDRLTIIGNAISADAVTRISAAQALVQAVANSRLPKDGSQDMTGPLRIVMSYPQILLKNIGGTHDGKAWLPYVAYEDASFCFQFQIGGASQGNKFSFYPTGAFSTAQLGDVKTYVDKGIRSDFAMGISRAAMQTARRNIAIRTGRRYFTGNGGVANITAADLGGLIYLEADINTCNFIGVNASVDGDFAEVYCRGNVRFNSAGTDAYGFGFGDANLSFFDAKSGDRFTLSMGADAWDVVGYTTRHNKALMADRALVLNDAERQQLYANADIAIPHGQCRLNYISPTQIRLDGFNGNKIFINGNYRTIPSGGLVLSNAGLAANTLYFIYATWDGSNVSIVPGSSSPKSDPLFGHKVANTGGSDASNRAYTLVGMIYTNSSSQFQSDNNYQFVASWFNRRLVSINGAGFGGAVAGGNAFINAGTAVYMLCWDDMAVRAYAFGYAIGGATGAYGQVRLLLDGGTVVGQTIAATFYANGANLPMPVQWSDKVVTGVHSINAQILGNGGGASFTSDVRMESWI